MKPRSESQPQEYNINDKNDQDDILGQGGGSKLDIESDHTEDLTERDIEKDIQTQPCSGMLQ